MNESFFISKERKLRLDEDFWFLRQEGLKYIEGLSSTYWTDYNTHDPGITILEALCYAITELGYRCGFNMKDLLATQDGTISANQPLFTAKQIFRNNPLTVEDYRKVLIDTIGVHNAFLYPARNVDDLPAAEIPKTEVPFYPECLKDRLTYANTDHPQIDVRGLYKVLVDLDTTEVYGDLNLGNILYHLTSPDLLGLNVEVVLPAWREADLVLVTTVSSSIISASATANNATGVFNVEVTYNDGSGNKVFPYTVRKTLQSPKEDADITVKQELEQVAVQQNILGLYTAKINEIDRILTECWQKLHSQRNLCEDFLSIDTVFYTGIAICADIEVTPLADIDEVLANVYFQVQEYLNPDVNFYLLNELLSKGLPTEDIFEGPALYHGFIDTEELKAAQLRTEIRVSDIINIIQDVAGVVAVKNVLLSSYDEKGNIIQGSQKWCIHVQPLHKPVLDIARSKVLFFKNRLPFKPKPAEVLDILRLLQGAEERPKLKGYQDDLPLPQGTYYQLDDYYSVKYELPQTYGVGTAGLSNEAPLPRRAQALQLRACLKFYDQLLANFFSQLFHAKDLFSLDSSVVNTYFAQYYTDAEDIKSEAAGGRESIYRDLFSLAAGKIINLASVTDAPVNLPLPADPNYEYARQRNLYHEKLIEDQDTFGDRRNRFLDHVLARFAETFDNNIFLLYTTGKERIAEKQLINDKILFLKDYPVISAERGKAFNYLSPSWDTDNVSGLEKRISRLAGIHNYFRRTLFCLPPYVITNNGTEAVPEYVFTINDKNGAAAFRSSEKFDTLEAVENAIDKFYEYMFTPANYTAADNGSGDFEATLADDVGTPIAITSSVFPGEAEAVQFVTTFIEESKPECDPEGMHLVEHILLRPFFPATPIAPQTPEEDYRLMQVCLNKDCLFCGEEDPYSFRASVFLPFWPEHFRDIDFRRYVEELFDTEAPAHTMIKVCWLSYTAMKKFEEIFAEWLEALSDYGNDLKKTNDLHKAAIKAASNKMVAFMATVHSEYPEARLYHCGNEKNKNPIRLGQTILGSF